MKLKNLFIIALSAVVAFSAADISAQARKGKATSKSAAAGKRAATGSKSMDKANLEDHLFFSLWQMPGTEKVGKDVGFFGEMVLDVDGSMNWNVVGKDLTGTWTLKNPTLNLTNGNFNIDLTSANGGNTLKGRFKTLNGDGGPLTFFRVKNGDLNGENFKNAIQKGTLKAIMEVYKSDDEDMGFPVEFKTTPNADGTGGTYKISADNSFALGIIKGTYTFTDDGVQFTSNLDNCSDDIYIGENAQRITVNLGKKKIEYAYRTIFLTLYVQ